LGSQLLFIAKKLVLREINVPLQLCTKRKDLSCRPRKTPNPCPSSHRSLLPYEWARLILLCFGTQDRRRFFFLHSPRCAGMPAAVGVRIPDRCYLTTETSTRATSSSANYYSKLLQITFPVFLLSLLYITLRILLGIGRRHEVSAPSSSCVF
jgi:hypothetical protein